MNKTTAGLAFGFLLVLLVWGLWIAGIVSISMDPGFDTASKADREAVTKVFQVAFFACIGVTIWFGTLVHHAVHSKEGK